jgi:hypothetical protein
MGSGEILWCSPVLLYSWVLCLRVCSPLLVFIFEFWAQFVHFRLLFFFFWSPLDFSRSSWAGMGIWFKRGKNTYSLNCVFACYINEKIEDVWSASWWVNKRNTPCGKCRKNRMRWILSSRFVSIWFIESGSRSCKWLIVNLIFCCYRWKHPVSKIHLKANVSRRVNCLESWNFAVQWPVGELFFGRSSTGVSLLCGFRSFS